MSLLNTLGVKLNGFQRYFLCASLPLLVHVGAAFSQTQTSGSHASANGAQPPIAATQQVSPISVTNAYAYIPLGKASGTQAFFTLRNQSQKAVSIVAITSPEVKKVVPVPSLQGKSWTIAEADQLVLKPGKQYLQLEGLKTSLTTGDELHFDISLSDGKKLLVIAKARSAYDQIHGH